MQPMSPSLCRRLICTVKQCDGKQTQDRPHFMHSLQLKLQISQKMTPQHSDVLAMCCTNNITVCDMCCFSCASSQVSYFKNIVNCLVFFTFINTKNESKHSVTTSYQENLIHLRLYIYRSQLCRWLHGSPVQKTTV